jgi:high-affinity iron transporter
VNAFFVTLREGLEAALIVGIVLAYLARIDASRDALRAVWIGTAAAVGVSIATGAALFFTIGELEGRAEQIFEGCAMFVAVAFLTWMIFWMRRQAAGMRASLEVRVRDALVAGSTIGLAGLVFFAVVREGWETALFLFAISETGSPAVTAIGAVLGLAAAVLLGVGFYRGSRRLNLRQFFAVTGVLLIVFAAGLLAHGVHEFQEAGLLPTTVEHVWNTNGAVHEDSRSGELLQALFGYNGNPSLLEVFLWASYLTIGLWFFLRPVLRLPDRTEAVPAHVP